jgi:hypothetical protein
MEIGQLEAILEAVPSQGIFLSQIERIRVACSLRLLQNQMKAEAMFFLGKIITLGDDYYLAFSTEVNKYMPSIYFCSQDAITWFSIASVDPETREEILQLRNPLTGVLTSECPVESGRIVNEELRLSAIISDMVENCVLIPRGFLVKTALNYILLNPTWTGLPLEKCQRMSSFRHWRERKQELSLLEKSLGNPALDFVDPLDDLTEWSFVFSDDSVHLKSIRWLGFEFSLSDDTFSNLYFGYGIPETHVTELITEVSPASERHKHIK